MGALGSVPVPSIGLLLAVCIWPHAEAPASSPSLPRLCFPSLSLWVLWLGGGVQKGHVRSAEGVPHLHKRTGGSEAAHKALARRGRS